MTNVINLHDYKQGRNNAKAKFNNMRAKHTEPSRFENAHAHMKEHLIGTDLLNLLLKGRSWSELSTDEAITIRQKMSKKWF